MTSTRSNIQTQGHLSTAQVLRRTLLGVISFGVIGTLTELFLMGHYKEATQWPPLILLALTAVGIVMMIINPTPRNVKLFRWLMVVVAVSSLVGIFFHLKGNIEFKLETKPDLAGLTLLWKSIRGGIPVLAPGMMAHVGLLGIAYTFRHPNMLQKPL
jgi:predicted membrane channel-forming protein YqfA (hemolysin III family)